MIRLFTTGTHNALTFSEGDIAGIYDKSKGSGKIPFVLGHPKNDLPILGWIGRDKLTLYTEGDKKSIGFDKGDAEFSEESMAALRQLKQNKLSVRLQDGQISHVGLVKTAAVWENNFQDFRQLESRNEQLEMDKLNGCFGVDGELPLGDKIPAFAGMTEGRAGMTEGGMMGVVQDFKNVLHEFKNLFKNKKDSDMSEKQLAMSNEQLEIEQLKKEVESLKKANADFQLAMSNKQLAMVKKQLEDKVKSLNYNEAKQKSTLEFGMALYEKEASLFQTWMDGLVAEKAPVVVKNGSVVVEAQDFGAEDKALAEMRRQHQVMRS